MNDLIPLMVIVPIIAALLLNLIHERNRTVKIISFVLAIVLPLIPILSNYGFYYFGGHVPLMDNHALLSYIPSNLLPPSILNGSLSTFHIGITYYFGGMQQILLFFLFLIGFLAIFTTLGERKRASGVYMFLMFMGIASVAAILLSDDIFHMYIFFEIAVMAQVGIVLASNDGRKYETAMKYMILGSIGGPMLLIGIGFLLGMVGSVNITDIVYAIQNGIINPKSPVLLLSFALIFFGWLYSTGLPPVHTIKSSIYSKAMPSGSALLQAMSVIIFIAFAITIFRIFAYISLVKVFIIFFSLLAMILSLTLAIMETDFKRVIGFLAVGELGYIGLGFGIGTKLSITAAIFQGLNEIIITALLFISFGVVLYLTKTSNISKLGGLIGKHPKIAIVTLLGGLAMAGVPPFNGFMSKFLLLQSALSANLPELAVIMILISIVTFMTFIKIFYSIYLKPKPNSLVLKDDVKIPKSTIFSMSVLLIICFILGIVPTLVTNGISMFVGGLF
jgi:energy-converting hydrogenase B subunit F